MYAEILKALPMFLRTTRSDKPAAEELDKLVDMIKKKKAFGRQNCDRID